MSRFLLLNFKDFGLNQDITQCIQPQTLVCICCLEKNIPFISLSTCKHSEFLNSFAKPALEPSMNVICFQCHIVLKKIELFRKQVEDAFKVLEAKTFNPLESEAIKNMNLEVKKTVNIYLPPAKYSMSQIKQISKTAKEKKPQSIQKEQEKRKKEPVLPVGEIKTEPHDKMEISIDTTPVLKDSSVSPVLLQKSPIPTQVPTTNQETSNTNSDNNDKNMSEEKSVTKKSTTEGKVRTVKLTKEELMRERVKEAQSDMYLKMPYKCDYCLIGFTYEENIKDHMKRKHGPKLGSVTCDICLTVLHPPGSLTAHYYRHLTRYDCERCGKRYANYDEAWNHYHKEHEILYKCTLCDFTTQFLGKFRHHRYKQHKKCVCKVCGLSLETRRAVRKHMLLMHKKRLWCVHCGARAQNARALAAHMRAHGADAARARCTRCDVAFRSWKGYISHWTLSEAHVADNRYPCEICRMRFSTETALSAHSQTEHDIEKCTCVDCNKIFSSTLDLMIHMKQHEKGASIIYFTCDYCDRNYTSLKQLARHIGTHMKETRNVIDVVPNSRIYT